MNITMKNVDKKYHSVIHKSSRTKFHCPTLKRDYSLNPWGLLTKPKPEEQLEEESMINENVDGWSCKQLADKYPDHTVYADYDGNIVLYHKYPNPNYKYLIDEYNEWVVLAAEAVEYMLSEHGIKVGMGKNIRILLQEGPIDA